MKKLRLDKLGKNLMPVQKHFRKYAELYLIVLGLLVGFWISRRKSDTSNFSHYLLHIIWD